MLIPSIATFIVSAIWHGFYPGYMVFFIGAGVMDAIVKLAEPLTVFFDDVHPIAPFYLFVYLWDYVMCAYWMMGF